MKKFALSNLLALALALGMVASTSLTARADATLDVSGTVVSKTSDLMVVKTDKGDVTFELGKETIMPASIAVGNRVTVSYDADANLTKKTDARKIVMAPEPMSTPVTTTPEPVRQVAPEPTPVSQPAPTMTQEETRELPQTASPFPLLACIGVLALAGAFLLRRRMPQA